MKFSWLSVVRGLSMPVLLVALTGACSSDTVAVDGEGPTTEAVLENYAANLHAAYADSVKDTEALKVALQALVNTPSAATLDAAKAAWLQSRANYMLTEGARFYDGPIDAEPANHEGAVNSWPFDEAYIDYVVDTGPTRTDGQLPGDGGIIADTSIELTADKLDELNAEGGDENISAGWHAIEFLLWGQAVQDVGPGQRTFNDYLTTDPTHGATAERRGQYLIAAVDGILGHLNALVRAWEPGAEYRTKFVANENDESVINALSGLGKMSKGELAGERINAGLESKERRDQHNCFSSTTLIDYERDARGIRDMFLGNYGENDGPGFDELVAAKDEALAKKVTDQLNASIDGLKGISVLFEQAIAAEDTDAERKKLIDVRESLRKQGDMFGESATALGLSLTIPEENP